MPRLNIGNIKGPTGSSATITVGTTTTGLPGTNASVSNVGTPSAAILNFVIPKGEKGDPSNGMNWTHLAKSRTWIDDKPNWQPYTEYSKYDYLVFILGEGEYKNQIWVKTSEISDGGSLSIRWTDIDEPGTNSVNLYCYSLSWATSPVQDHEHGGDISDNVTPGYKSLIVLGGSSYSRSNIISYANCITDIYGVKLI